MSTTPASSVAVGRRVVAATADWPRTTRVLPWFVAALLVVIMLVPFDSVTLPVALPVDAKPDRVLLVLGFVAWALVAAVSPRSLRRPGHRYGGFELVTVLFILAAVASIALDASTLRALGQVQGGVKQLSSLVAYFGFFVFVVNVVRPSEVPAFVRMVVALGTFAALGTALEFATGFNVFFSVTQLFAPPGTRIASSAMVTVPGGRVDVTGPARHGLAVSSLLAMVLPFALAGAVSARERVDKLLFRIAAAVMFLGCLSTVRRSGVVLPFVASLGVIVLGGRRMLPIAAAFVVLLVVTPFVAPGAVQELADQFSTSNVSAQQSISGRTSDYPAVVPDIRAHIVFGRGFGTYGYRFLDNQIIGLTIETGAIGISLYALMILTAIATAVRLSRAAAGGIQAWIGLAAIGSFVSFLLANALFDTLGFPQAPYGFFLIIAFVTLAREGGADAADVWKSPPEASAAPGDASGSVPHR